MIKAKRYLKVNLMNRLHDDGSFYATSILAECIEILFEFLVGTTLLLAEAVKTKVLCLCLRKIRSGL